jgi:acetolactate synthase-1/2/3 large subunit
VTGIATAMLDSVPIVCITGQVSSKVLGTDAFQEVDITGITLPVTKHNYVVTRAEDVARTIREAFLVAKSGRPGPVLVDITKDAQQATAEFDFAAAAPKPHRPHPMLKTESASILAAAELIRNAKKPVILAGHGVLQSRAGAELRTLAERMRIPVASAGAGWISGFAPAVAGHDGDARRGVGESCDPAIGFADRVRDALRRSRDGNAGDVCAGCEEDSHRGGSGGD